MTRISPNYYQKNLNRHSAPAFGALKPITLDPAKWKVLEKLGGNFTTYHQRMVIGGTALLLIPFIELKNKKVDDETRQTGASRAIGRAIIGTAIGVAVRWGSIKAGKFFTAKEGRLFHLQALDALKKTAPDQVERYANAVGNILSFAVLPFTNLFIDAPLISKMSRAINKNVFKHKQEGEVGK